MHLMCKSRIEKAWLVASMLVFVAHRMMEATASGHFTTAVPLMRWLEAAMILLSFPLGGLVLFVIQDAVYWCDGCRDVEWMLDWSTLLFAGYIQWFWVLPEVLRRRKLNFLNLNLNQPAEIVLPNNSATVPETPQAVSAAATFTPLLAEFDASGLTALDRVLRE